MKAKRLSTGLTTIPIMLLAGFGLLLMNPIFVGLVEGFPQSPDPTPKSKAPSENSAERSRRRESPAVYASPRRTIRRPNVANQVERALTRGDAQLAGENYAQAERAYRQALLLSPNDFRAYCGLGDVFYGQARGPDAVQAFTKCVRVNPAYGHNGLGNVYADLQQLYPNAVEEYKKVIELDPKGAYAYSNLGNVYFNQERYTDAIEEYKKAVELDLGDVATYNNLGWAYYRQANYPEAIEQYKKAIEIFCVSPDWPIVRQVETEAIERFKWVIENDAIHKGAAYTGLGFVYYAQKHYPEAIEQFKKTLELESNNPDSHWGLGVAYLRTNNQAAAREQYEVLKNLGSDYAEKLVSKMIEQYKQAIEFDPGDATAYGNMGWTYYLLKDYPEAIEQYKNAIELFCAYPASPSVRQAETEAIERFKWVIENDAIHKGAAYTGLGFTFYAQQQYADAIGQFKKTLELDPNNPDAHYGLGLAYLHANNKPAARTQYDVLNNLGSYYAKKLLGKINKY